MNFRNLAFISGTANDPALCSNVLREHGAKERTVAKGWNDVFGRIADWIDGGMGEDAPFQIFVKGNGKLPFWAFSSLPGANFCPGAGDCLNWCYSFKAWQYPAAFGRQIVNTLLMLHKRDAIRKAWNDIPTGDYVRLYVDGDFGDIQQLQFWMRLCKDRSDLKIYGYSKSFSLFLKAEQNGIEWPDNYILNLSGGHKYDSVTVDKMRALPVTRGEFIGIDIGRRVFSKDHGTKEVNKLLRESAKAMGLGKVFTCPGKCGECTKREHACGSRRFDGIPIVIASH